MPTLRSIGVHPDLCQRLVTESTIPTKPQGGGPVVQQQHRMLVSTPQALLSRNPGQLRVLTADGSTTRPIPLSQAEELRCQVAKAMIRLSKTGVRLSASSGHVISNSTRDGAKENSTPTEESSQSVWDLWQCHQQTSNVLSPFTTGCPQLDTALFPGPQTSGMLVQCSGPPGVGKTRLATQLVAATIQQRSNCSFWYLYTGSLPIESMLSGVGTVTVRGPLSRPYQLLAQLTQLEEELLVLAGDKRPLVLVIDSISECCSAMVTASTKLHRNNSSYSNYYWLDRVGYTCKRLVRQYHNCSIFLVNGTVANGTQPALGSSWNASVPDVSIWMSTHPSHHGSAVCQVTHRATGTSFHRNVSWNGGAGVML